MMDALEFIKAIKQMLSAEANDSTVQKYISAYKKNDYEEMVKAAEQWAAGRTAKTRQSVFLEQYPETEIDKYGCLRLCPELVSADYRNRHGDCINRVCIDCRREFWLAEVEDT